MNFDIDITTECQLWDELDFDKDLITTEAIKKVVERELSHKNHIEISIVLVEDEFIKALNHKYRGINKPTNVLSFPISETEDIASQSPFISLGDIIISYDTIKREAHEQEKALKDHYTHMLIHGCLHLLHYDHIDDDEAEEMESIEISILDALGIKNPYEIV